MQLYACFREFESLVGMYCVYLALILPGRVIWRRPRRRVGDGRGQTLAMARLGLANERRVPI